MDPGQIKLVATDVVGAGGIIFCGALYATFYALGRLSENVRLIRLGFFSYAGLLLCAALLADTLDLHSVWRGLFPCLQLGYLLAPPLIWRVYTGIRVVETRRESSR